MVFNGEQENESINCEDGIEKSVPGYHCLSSLSKPHDVKRQDSGDFFYLTLMIDSYWSSYHSKLKLHGHCVLNM